MRLLMINSNQERSPWPVPPLGACAVASAAQEAGHEVRMLDLCFEPRPRRAVGRAVDEYRPDLIGVSVRNIDNVDWQSPQFYLPQVKADVVDACKERARCPIVVGGPAAGIMPEEMLEFMDVDFVVRGDGEVAIVHLLEALGGARSLGKVAGLTWREDGQVRRNDSARVADLDELPLPRVHQWVDLPRYQAYNGSVGVQTKRGCALQCTYCVYNRIEGSCYRLKSPQRVVSEIAEAVTQGGARAIEFVDSTFNVPLRHALAICRELAGQDFDAQFSTMGINPGQVTGELFELLRKANFTEISITPESASPPVLRALGKNFDVADLVRTADLARRAKMPVVWYFMFGGPGESEATVRETTAFMAEHIPENHLVLMVSGIRIFEGAPLADRARQEGQIAADASLLEPVWYRPDIPRQRLFEMLDQAMLQHPNWISLQDNRVPTPVIRTVSALHRIFRSRKPV